MKPKSRRDVAAFINAQMSGDHVCTREKKGKHHYGLQELKELMDFIYGEEPSDMNEWLF